MSLMGGISAGLGAVGMLSGLDDDGQIRQQQKLTDQQVEAQKDIGKFNAEQAIMMWKNTGVGAQVKELEKAGLSKSLMMAKGGGPTGQTTGGQAGSVTGGQAEGPSQSLMAKVQGAQALANIELTKAQASKTKAEEEKLSGVDTAKTNAEIASLTQGITNAKAVEILTKAQTVMQGLQNNITERTTEQQIELAEWTTEKALTDLKLARNEEYISSTTINEKVGIIQQEAITSVLQNVAIKQGVELSQEQINKMKADVAQGWQKLALEADKNKQGWEGLSQQERQIKINEFTETIKANNPSIMNVAGGVVDNTINMLLDLPRKMGLGFGGRMQPYQVDK